jgi:hypothetical protein
MTRIAEALQHTESPHESIPFFLKKMDCEMLTTALPNAFTTGLAAAHLLGPGLALPDTNSKAERFAEAMYPRILLTPEEILALADLQPLENKTIALLQEILSKLGNSLGSLTVVFSAFVTRPQYLDAICLLSFYHVVTHGVTPYAACMSLSWFNHRPATPTWSYSRSFSIR